MEMLNRIEIIGVAGQPHVENVNDVPILRLPVMTEYAYLLPDGQSMLETTWFLAVIPQPACQTPVKDIRKGDPVHLKGRMRARTYYSEGGYKRTVMEVIVRTAEVLSTDSLMAESAEDR